MKFFLIFPLWLVGVFSLLFFGFFQLLSVKKNLFAQNSEVFFPYINFLTVNHSFVNQGKSSIPESDLRVGALKMFLTEYKSPLAPFAEEIVHQSDIYGIDYTLIPAIAMQESNGCKVIPPDSYNCWGLGIYGEKILRFSSYEEAIEKVARTIKEAYIKKGLTNATLVEDKWTPSSKGNWSYGVNYFIGKIKEYEKKFSAS